MSARAVVGWMACLALACALALPARAARPSPVEKLAADAASAYRNGDYAKAAELLERAYQAQPVSAILYNLAKAYEKQGDSEKALDRYQRYLAADDADPRLKARAEARVAALKDSLAPKTPPPVENNPTTPPPPQQQPIVITPPPAPAPPADDRFQRANRARGRDRGAAIGLGVTGIAALGAAIGLTVNALSLHGQFAGSLDENDKRSLRDSAQTQLIVADVLYAVSAVAICAASYFLYRGLKPLPRSGRLALEVRF